MIGKTLGQRYLIEEELNEGGMGTVYKAQHIYLKQPVALKVLLPLNSDDTIRKRFLNEAHKAMECKHDNVVGMYDYIDNTTTGVHFLVMEYVPGKNLKTYIETFNGSVPVKYIIEIFRQICNGLKEIHKNKIIHRDLKPENIQIQELQDGSLRAVILDFGIAKAPLDPKLTVAGRTPGTYTYMSPEQAVGKETLDRRSDVYSLGVVLYHLMTGSPPFTQTNIEALIEAHRKEPPKPIRETRKELPKKFQRVMDKALAKDPEKRYHDAQAFLDDFNEVVNPTKKPLYKYASLWVTLGFLGLATAIGLNWRYVVQQAYATLKWPQSEQAFMAADEHLLNNELNAAVDKYTEAIDALKTEGYAGKLDTDQRMSLLQKQLVVLLATSDKPDNISDSLTTQRDTLISLFSRAALATEEGRLKDARMAYTEAATLLSPSWISVLPITDSLLTAGALEEANASMDSLQSVDASIQALLGLIKQTMGKISEDT